VPNPWPNSANFPVSAAAVLAALHFREPRTEALAQFDDRAWRAALKFCDRSRLTLALWETARESMPQWVRERTNENAAKNRQRLAQIEETYRELALLLRVDGVDFLALKGITQCALFGLPPDSRVQYDIDLFAPLDHVYRARNALERSGYEAVKALEGFPTDHLPVMIRKTGWEWRGDYFDVEIPLSVDLHFQFWNEAVERLPAPGTAVFWNRRVRRPVAGCDLSMLAPVDALGYTALHLLRHLLRGSVTPFHVYEMALLLHSLAEDASFWRQWQRLHPPELRRLEAVAFRLAAEWFGCAMSLQAEEATAQLSHGTQIWFAQFAKSPATTPFHPNKDELWLHCSLINSPKDIFTVVRRRLLPANLPPRGGDLHVPKGQLTWRQRAREWLQYTAYTLGRFWHHAISLLRIGRLGSRWWCASVMLQCWRARSR
jgi:Uncharacterised nucleotidyltransferase